MVTNRSIEYTQIREDGSTLTSKISGTSNELAKLAKITNAFASLSKNTVTAADRVNITDYTDNSIINLTPETSIETTADVVLVANYADSVTIKSLSSECYVINRGKNFSINFPTSKGCSLETSGHPTILMLGTYDNKFKSVTGFEPETDWFCVDDTSQPWGGVIVQGSISPYFGHCFIAHRETYPSSKSCVTLKNIEKGTTIKYKLKSKLNDDFETIVIE